MERERRGNDVMGVKWETWIKQENNEENPGWRILPSALFSRCLCINLSKLKRFFGVIIIKKPLMAQGSTNQLDKCNISVESVSIVRLIKCNKSEWQQNLSVDISTTHKK